MRRKKIEKIVRRKVWRKVTFKNNVWFLWWWLSLKWKKCNQATGSRSVRTEMVKEVEEDLKKDITRERKVGESETFWGSNEREGRETIYLFNIHVSLSCSHSHPFSWYLLDSLNNIIQTLKTSFVLTYWNYPPLNQKFIWFFNNTPHTFSTIPKHQVHGRPKTHSLKLNPFWVTSDLWESWTIIDIK